MSNNSDTVIPLEFNFTPSNYNILILEDSKTMNKIINITLSKNNYNCFSAFSIKEARDIIQNNHIDYILLDLNLPDGNGSELIDELNDKDIKIFVLTNETNKDIMHKFYQYGVIDFVIKDKNCFHKIDEICVSIEQLEKNHSKTILVVDDSIVIQAQLKNLFSSRNYHVEVCGDTKSALNILAKQKIDLMLLDIMSLFVKTT